MITKTTQIDFEISAEEIATEFHDMDEFDQADVFNNMGKQTKKWTDKARQQQLADLVVNLDKDGAAFLNDLWSSYIEKVIEPNERDRTGGASNRVSRGPKPNDIPRGIVIPGDDRRRVKTTKKK